MDLLKALAMPFHAGSMLFVITSSLLLGLIFTISSSVAFGFIPFLLGLPATLLVLICLTRYTFTLIDDATNGRPEASPATAEMFSPWEDARCWVHPILTGLVGLALALRPEIPRLPVLAACALLFPASVGAIALSGRALDAINPIALARVMGGLAHYYLLAVLWVTLCVAVGVLVMISGLWIILKITALQLLLLLACAFIGGALYARRMELNFTPLVSPERLEQQDEDDRIARRQRMIDEVYQHLRAREGTRSLASARQWLEQAGAQQLPGDVRALLDAGTNWSDRHAFALLLRGLVRQLLALRQPALAFEAVEAGLNAAPAFTPEQEADAVVMIRYALHTGRKRLAATLLANFMRSEAGKGTPGLELQDLRARLHNEPAAHADK